MSDHNNSGSRGGYRRPAGTQYGQRPAAEIQALSLPRDYLDQAESLMRQDCGRITTSKLRRIYSLAIEVYNKELLRTDEELSQDSVSAIGAIDSPVIRDAYTGRPIVPGSSLKGKLRSLLARSLSRDVEHLPSFDDDDVSIKRVFGSAKPARAARAQFADCFITNHEEMKHVGLTESKSENAINRTDCIATPRQIERVNPGVRFGVRITYNVVDQEQTEEDLKLLAKGMKLLEMDYLGGHGSRGSGRVSFRNFQVTDGAGERRLKLEPIFEAVSTYELFPVQAEV